VRSKFSRRSYKNQRYINGVRVTRKSLDALIRAKQKEAAAEALRQKQEMARKTQEKAAARAKRKAAAEAARAVVEKRKASVEQEADGVREESNVNNG